MPDPAPDEIAYFKRLRAGCARPVTHDVPHGDRCPRLTLRGVGFAIPPRGVRITPRFDGPAVRVETACLDKDLDADARRLLALAPLRGKSCPRCGQATGGRIQIDPAGGSEFLARCFSLAGRLLQRHYDLNDQQLTQLLSFPTDQPPVWIAELLTWSAGLPTSPPSAPPLRPAGPAEHHAAPGPGCRGGLRNLLRRLRARLRG